MSSQVKRKAAEIDEMIRQNAAAAQHEPEADSPATPDDTVVATQEPGESAEVLEFEAVEQEPVTEDTEEVVPLDATSQQLAELQAQVEKADQRWRSLQGQIGSKDKQIEQLHHLLGNMQAATPAEPDNPQLPAGYTDADVEAFGEDMIDVISRVARKMAEEQLGGVASKVDAMSSELDAVSQVTAQTVAETFDTKLDQSVHTGIDWRKLDTDEGFNAWLDESARRRQIFTGYAQSRDHVGVAEFFNQYGVLQGLVQKDAEEKKQAKSDKLQRQVAPGKSKSTATPVQSSPEERNWTASEISKIYSDYSAKRITAEKFAAYEKDITRAMAENRVDYNG